jgi:hypothetical protein
MASFSRLCLSVSTAASLFLVACGSKETPSQPIQRKIPRGEKLFESSLSLKQINSARQLFLKNQGKSVSVSSTGHNLHHLDVSNFEMDGFVVPQTPLFATYHEPQGSVTLAIKLSSDFNRNIPTEIQAEIRKKDIENLDVFIVAQEYLSGIYYSTPDDTLRLRAHFWAAPLGPHSFGTSLSGNLQIGLYAFDQDIEGELQNRQLTKVDWSIHPDSGRLVTLYSPANAAVNWTPSQANQSGWSLVIDEKNNHAAATLHAFFTDSPLGPGSPHSRFKTILENSHTLSEIMETMKTDPVFSSFLTKLKKLTRDECASKGFKKAGGLINNSDTHAGS